jgi:hypothetical protein
MEKKRILMLGAGGAAGVLAIAAAGFALAPGHRGLAALDADEDGRIVTAEVQQAARRRFAALDANGDGRLTAEEMPRGRHGRGHRGHGGHGRGPHDDFGGNEAQPAAAAPAAAANDVTTAAPAQTAAPVPAAPPRRGLAAADVDGDGALNLREYYAHLSARVARADADRDGTVSAEELRAHRPRRHGGGH